MKIHLMSDLHLDHDITADQRFLDSLKPQPEIDLLVVAGDTYSVTSDHAVFFAQMLALYPEVLFVPGNHDYWRATSISEADRLMSLDDARLHICLRPTLLRIKERTFYAGTMWYPEEAGTGFIDFRMMPRDGEEFVFDQNKAFKSAFEDGLIDRNAIVVTHHLPSGLSTPPQFRGSPNNAFFVCDMDAEIKRYQPKLWLHGHTHTAFDYMIGETRVVCHPRGYPYEYRGADEYAPKEIIL